MGFVRQKRYRCGHTSLRRTLFGILGLWFLLTYYTKGARNPVELTIATTVSFGGGEPLASEISKLASSIASYRQIGAVTQVFVFTDRARDCETLWKYGISRRHRSGVYCVLIECERDTAAPTINCIFRSMKERATGAFMAYVNSDVLLFEGVVTSYRFLSKTQKDFAVVGRRTDVVTNSVTSTVLRTSDVAEKRFRRIGQLHAATGLDYFILPTHFDLVDFPDFRVGAWRWDNALTLHLIKSKYQIIDATDVISAIHLGINDGTKAVHELRKEAARNAHLANMRYGRAIHLGTIDIAHSRLVARDIDDLILVPNRHYLMQLCILHTSDFQAKLELVDARRWTASDIVNDIKRKRSDTVRYLVLQSDYLRMQGLSKVCPINHYRQTSSKKVLSLILNDLVDFGFDPYFRSLFYTGSTDVEQN